MAGPPATAKRGKREVEYFVVADYPTAWFGGPFSHIGFWPQFTTFGRFWQW